MTTSMTPTADVLQELYTKFDELEKQNKLLSDRIHVTEGAVKAVMEMLSKQEKLFELRVCKVLAGFYHGMTDSINDAVTTAQREFKNQQRGFTIEKVDDKNVLRNDKTIQVTKTETGYDFASVHTPEKIQNDNTGHFEEWLKENDEIFEGQQSCLVNISIYKEV